MKSFSLAFAFGSMNTAHAFVPNMNFATTKIDCTAKLKRTSQNRLHDCSAIFSPSSLLFASLATNEETSPDPMRDGDRNQLEQKKIAMVSQYFKQWKQNECINNSDSPSFFY